jgi:hypothetical protein
VVWFRTIRRCSTDRGRTAISDTRLCCPVGLVATSGRLAGVSAEGDDNVNSTSPGRAINPPQAAAGPVGEPAPPVRRIVRLDAEYLSAGARPQPDPDAIEPEEEQLIVLPRRSGSLLARLFRWIFG